MHANWYCVITFIIDQTYKTRRWLCGSAHNTYQREPGYSSIYPRLGVHLEQWYVRTLLRGIYGVAGAI